MKKVTTFVLMLCLVLSGAFCYASGEDRQETKEDKLPISVMVKTQHGGPDKSGSINPKIDSHVLTVVFNENLGQVYTEVTTLSGATVDASMTITPNGIMFYIPNTGDYIINFTLSNGDEYYGEFEVTN